MSQHCSMVSYHPAQPGQITPGQLVAVDDTHVDHISWYLHPDHCDERLYQDLNRVLGHNIGHRIWVGWSQEELIRLPVDGYRRAAVRWEIVPAAKMPKRRNLVVLEEEGNQIWLIREHYVTPELRDEVNVHLGRIDRGLWVQHWPFGLQRRARTASNARGPVVAAPRLPALCVM